MKDQDRRRGKRAALLAGLLVLTQALGGCFLTPDPTLDPLAVDPNQTPIPFGPTATATAQPTSAPSATPEPSSGASGGWENWAPVEQLPAPTPTPVAAAPTAPPSSWQTSTEDYYAGYPVLKVGSTGSDVSDMQTRLKELGYYTGSIDGRFAGGTQDAVKAFQTANGLTADGIAGRATQDKLYASGAIAKTITTAGTADTYTLLKNGSYGTDVRKLQARLTELGYYAGGVDGVYGESTQSAVKTFQRANNLSADGQAGEATQKKLYSSSAKSNSRPVTTANPNATRSLSIGMEGNDVFSAQERLVKLGYLTGVADGVFGAETQSAVLAFQKRNNLTQDGVVGASTLKKLNSSSAKSAGAAATATPSPGTYAALREGDSGTLVFDLQERLYELGYYSGRIDGRFGAGTTTAVKAFQAANGLTADGIAGQATQKKAYASDAKFNPELIGSGAAPSATPTPAPGSATLLKRGSTGEDVRRLQQALRSLGYYSETVDGTYGASTEAAVRLFQTYNDMRADGVAGEQTLGTLYGGNAFGYPGNQSPSPTATPQGSYATLKEGDVSEQVRRMQKRLYALGYLPEYLTDGDYGTRTVEAVRNFQRRNGLTEDGVAGPGTLAVLYAASALPYADDAAGGGGAQTDGVELDALMTGSQGGEVTQLQKALADTGCFASSADGIFGSSTATAVKIFQALNGLTADGIAGRETLALLYSGSGKGIRDLELSNLSEGSTGDAVAALQLSLEGLGYLKISALGVFDEQTAAAVVRFQADYGLDQTGIATLSAQTLLYSGQAKPVAID